MVRLPIPIPARKHSPKSVAEGEIKIGSYRLPCAVLEDGSHLVTQLAMLNALGRKGKAGGLRKVGVFGLPDEVLSFCDKDLAGSTNPVRFIPKQHGKALGYPAELLTQICKAYLRARRAGILRENQMAMAERCEILMEAFADIGLNALIDEATGYQYVRPKDALQIKLELILREKAGLWEHTFPERFYELIFKLKHRRYSPERIRERWLGHVTNEIVYSRLDEGVLEALSIKNPTLPDKGYRKDKHHQWLTPEMGREMLRLHINKVIAYMEAAHDSWWLFMNILDQNCPLRGSMAPLFALPDLVGVPETRAVECS